MLPSEVTDDLDVIRPLLSRSGWLLQEKMDGKRALVTASPGSAAAISRQDKPLSLSDAQLSAALSSVPASVVLDGELLGPSGDRTLWVFDILHHDGADLCGLPLVDRLARAEAVVAAIGSPRVRFVSVSVSAVDKIARAGALHDSGREGFVLKASQSRYRPGRPRRGGPWVKFKFVSECTVRSGGIQGKGRSFSFLMTVRAGGQWVPCGRCTIPWNGGHDRADFAEGVLWEVRYLYATPAHVLYQPRIKMKRDDVALDGVTRAQFRYRG